MIYELLNKPKHIEITLIDNAISFACDYLEIDQDFSLRFERLNNGQIGFCDYLDEDEITICIARNVSPTDFLQTLFHEMVHMKQYIEGTLEDLDYEGPYAESPWEEEAYRLEEQMFKEFVDTTDCLI